jgi:hypothetical protein
MNPNSITTIIRVRATFTAGVDTDGSEKLVVKTIVKLTAEIKPGILSQMKLLP